MCYTNVLFQTMCAFVHALNNTTTCKSHTHTPDIRIYIADIFSKLHAEKVRRRDNQTIYIIDLQIYYHYREQGSTVVFTLCPRKS